MLDTDPGLRLRQRLMEEAIKAGNVKAVRELERAVSDYLRNDRPEPERCESDFTDRCGSLR